MGTESSARAVSRGAAARVGPTEAAFQHAVIETATLYGWKHCHTRKATVRNGRIATPTSIPGWPDLVLWNPKRGGVVFAELKRDGAKPTPTQQAVLDSLRLAGATVHVWRPRDWDYVVRLLSGAARGSEGDGPHQQGKVKP